MSFQFQQGATPAIDIKLPIDHSKVVQHIIVGIKEKNSIDAEMLIYKSSVNGEVILTDPSQDIYTISLTERETRRLKADKAYIGVHIRYTDGYVPSVSVQEVTVDAGLFRGGEVID